MVMNSRCHVRVSYFPVWMMGLMRCAVCFALLLFPVVPVTCSTILPWWNWYLLVIFGVFWGVQLKSDFPPWKHSCSLFITPQRLVTLPNRWVKQQFVWWAIGTRGDFKGFSLLSADVLYLTQHLLHWQEKPYLCCDGASSKHGLHFRVCDSNIALTVHVHHDALPFAAC